MRRGSRREFANLAVDKVSRRDLQSLAAQRRRPWGSLGLAVEFPKTKLQRCRYMVGSRLLDMWDVADIVRTEVAAAERMEPCEKFWVFVATNES